ncbi:MAG: adenylate/guanylate cyclase domain-containing protein [Acidimicrobiales bacterium]|nr:adenylate/guanylate cyclase domain-containing protein [Acidimicrobiales bacterium]
MAADETPTTVARVERTFAFVDLSGFTSFTDANGDGPAVGVLARFRADLRSVASHKGVRVAKWLGDGAMLVGVEVEDLVEAIIDIEHLIDVHQSPLPLRAGIASGKVILFEGDDYIGSAVNLASRLCDLAKPHEVLAPASLWSPLLVNTQATPIGAHRVRGFADPLELVRLHLAA